MEPKEMLKHIDHTLLQPTARMAEIEELCKEALEYQTASVCIPSCYVRRVHDSFGDQINICTVIGFPLGYCQQEAKLAEAEQALKDGAGEFDMVINISDVKNNDYQKVKDEITALKQAVGARILKVIIETCYLTEAEKIKMCEVVTRAGADYIKTSTGFGTGGAVLSDIRLFKENLGAGVKIKAAGGIRSLSELEAFLQEGCDRIGTSSAVKLIRGQMAEGY